LFLVDLVIGASNPSFSLVDSEDDDLLISPSPSPSNNTKDDPESDDDYDVNPLLNSPSHSYKSKLNSSSLNDQRTSKSFEILKFSLNFVLFS
jgi:hypothetical protein